ncbi:keratinocyte-associated protein 3 [Monodelphis domestica]|uniref:keratinocyte-associated protein 3 n=1 Tax=Monodelphis domestica TaxID=13616 RepID=UPI00028BEBD1|nr:keratinocyte-associated protein 3 [Monodelphis domestica]
MCNRCRFDAALGPRRLMRAGLALILVGHVNLLVGAVLHGTVLRHVANPRGAITPEYTTANVVSVGSGLLSIAAGLVALLASRNLLLAPLHWALLAVSLLNLLLSATCSLGLLLAFSLTVANQGRRLLAQCSQSHLDSNAPAKDCPFDPTRIYETALALWLPSVFMAAAEATLSGYCCVAALALRGFKPCGDEELLQQLQELAEPESPKGKSQESQQLLEQSQEIQAVRKIWV